MHTALLRLSKKTAATYEIGFGNRGLLEKGSFQKGPLCRDSREFLENPQTVENKAEPDPFLEILENLEILEIPPVKRPFS